MSIADDIYNSKSGGVATVYPPDEEAKQLADRLNGKVFIYYYKVVDEEKQPEKAYSIDISTAGYKPSFLEKLFRGDYAGRFAAGLHVPQL